MFDVWSFLSALWVLTLVERLYRCPPDSVLLWPRSSGWSLRFPYSYPANGDWGWRFWGFWPLGALGFQLNNDGPKAKLHALALLSEVQRLRLMARKVQVLVGVETIVILIAWPAAALWLGSSTLIPGIVCVVILDLAIAVSAWRLQKSLPAQKSMAACLKYALYPPAALMAISDLTRSQLDHFPMVPTAIVLAKASTPLDWVRRFWAARVYGPHEERSESELLELRDALKAAGISWRTLADPPQPQSSQILHFCPACHTQFRFSSGRCPDCADMPTIAYPTERSIAN